MDSLFLLLVFFGLVWIISTSITGDLLSPASLFSLMFLFSTMMANYIKDFWGFRMGNGTLLVLILGVLVFNLVSFAVMFKSKKEFKLNSEKAICDFSSRAIRINTTKVVVIIVIYLVLSSIYIYYMTSAVGNNDFSSIASQYRRLTMEGKQVPILGRFCLNILRAMSTVLVCVLVNNYFAKAFLVNHGIILLSCSLVYVLITILSGERTSALRFAGFFVLAYSVFWQRNNRFRSFISIKHLVVGLIGAIIVLYLFSYIRFFVGRASKLNMIDYIALYTGGPIYNLDRFVSNIFSEPTYDGHKVFLGLFNNMARLGMGEIRSVHRDSVYIMNRSIYTGNVYTCFYDYYYDYGIIGVVVLISIYSYVINTLYVSAKYARVNSVLKCSYYLFVGSTLFFVSFTEQFFSTYFALISLVIIIGIGLFSRFLLQSKIKTLRLRIR